MILKVYFATLPHSAEAHPTFDQLAFDCIYAAPARIGCMVFLIGIDIIRLVLITLERRNGPQEVDARVYTAVL